MYDKIFQIKKKINEMRLVPCLAIELGSCGLQNLLVLDANSPIAQRLKYPYLGASSPKLSHGLFLKWTRLQRFFLGYLNIFFMA
jgi:hypothetical protein